MLRRLAVLLCLACLACDSGSPTSPTNGVEDDDPITEPTGLNATMTVGEMLDDHTGGLERGYRSTTRDVPCYWVVGERTGGSLVPELFTVNGIDYCVVALTIEQGSNRVRLRVGGRPLLPESAVLHLDGVALTLSDSDGATFEFGGRYDWTDTGIKAWDVGQTVKVQIADE